MNERIVDNLDHPTTSSEKEALFADIRKECHELANDIVPEVGELQTLIKLLQESLKEENDPWKHFISFQNVAKELAKWSSKVPYLTREKAISADMAEQFSLAKDLRQKFTTYCNFQKEQLNNQYRHIQKDLLPQATSADRKTELHSICALLKDIDRVYDEIIALWADEYQEVRDLLENKKFVIDYELKKMDPWGRYDKDELKKAEERTKHGTPTSLKNALQYFWGSPITAEDAGKCGLTNETIQRNAQIFRDLQETAIARSKTRKAREIAKWDPTVAIDVPDLTTLLNWAAVMIKNVQADMQKIGIHTEILDRKMTDK